MSYNLILSVWFCSFYFYSNLPGYYDNLQHYSCMGPRLVVLPTKEEERRPFCQTEIKGAWVFMVVRAYYGLSWQPKPQINSNFL